MSCIFLYFQLQSITASLYPILLRIVSWVVLRWKVTYLTAVCFTDVCWRVPLKHMQGMDIIWIIFHRACQVVIASIIVATVVQVMKLCMLCYLLLLLELQIRPTPCHVSVLSFTIALYYKHTHTHTHIHSFYGSMDFVRTPGWAGTRRNIHDSPTHNYPGHQSPLICFIHLIWSMVSSLFNPCIWQSFSTICLQVFFGLFLGLTPSTSYSIHFFTQSLSSFHNTCPYHRNLFCCSTEIVT